MPRLAVPCRTSPCHTLSRRALHPVIYRTGSSILRHTRPTDGEPVNISITLTGSTGLLMHNARLANPLDPAAIAVKAVTAKQKKTEGDHIEIARREHYGSLYLDPDIGPYLPGQNIERCIRDAGKVTKSGMKVVRGLFVSTDVNPVAYAGPRDAAGLWADENFRYITSVRVGMKRVMRCRPLFRTWKVQAEGTLDTEVLSFEDLRTIADTAGSMIGLGDNRPRYGRFTTVVEKL